MLGCPKHMVFPCYMSKNHEDQITKKAKMFRNVVRVPLQTIFSRFMLFVAVVVSVMIKARMQSITSDKQL